MNIYVKFLFGILSLVVGLIGFIFEPKVKGIFVYGLILVVGIIIVLDSIEDYKTKDSYASEDKNEKLNKQVKNGN